MGSIPHSQPLPKPLLPTLPAHFPHSYQALPIHFQPTSNTLSTDLPHTGQIISSSSFQTVTCPDPSRNEMRHCGYHILHSFDACCIRMRCLKLQSITVPSPRITNERCAKSHPETSQPRIRNERSVDELEFIRGISTMRAQLRATGMV